MKNYTYRIKVKLNIEADVDLNEILKIGGKVEDAFCKKIVVAVVSTHGREGGVVAFAESYELVGQFMRWVSLKSNFESITFSPISAAGEEDPALEITTTKHDHHLYN